MQRTDPGAEPLQSELQGRTRRQRALMLRSSGYRNWKDVGCWQALITALPRSTAPSPPRAWWKHTTASNAPAAEHTAGY